MMRGIRQLQLIGVAVGNAARQGVTSAALVLLAAACAPSAMPLGPDAEPADDARPLPTADAHMAADAAPSPDPDAGPDAGPTADGGLSPDATPAPDAAADDDAAPAPYRHTVVIDGANDFSEAHDAFATTSASYAAYVSWDDTHVYVGYQGGDIGSGDGKRWLMVYFDRDPGASTGAAVGERYNTQQPGFPTGFGAEYYFRWKASNDFQDVQAFAADTWSDTGVVPSTYQSGTFVETAIPRAALGDPAALGVVALMLNETDLAEGAYAGLYADAFTDDYYDADIAPIPIAAYLRVDFASSAPPNAAANQR